nr:hypothetical protein [uncultured Butyrivibrio sp.]
MTFTKLNDDIVREIEKLDLEIKHLQGNQEAENLISEIKYLQGKRDAYNSIRLELIGAVECENKCAAKKQKGSIVNIIVQRAKERYPLPVCYGGTLSEEERSEIEKVCDITRVPVFEQGSRILYKEGSQALRFRYRTGGEAK